MPRDTKGGIPTTPTGPPSTGSTPGGSGSGGSGAGSGASGAGGSSGSGGGGGYGSQAWYNRTQAKARNKYLQQARTIGQQVAALRDALNGEFRDALAVKLANVQRAQQQQDRMVLEGYQSRVNDLKGAAADNAKATSDSTFMALTNAGRERANAMAEAMNSGAGESDVLQAQQMALRNWDANKSEIDRSNADTLRSINSGLGDLNVDTKTARQNIALQSNADKEQLWTNYYNQMSEAWTNLGNTLGAQADAYGSAVEVGGGKGAKAKQKRAQRQSGRAFDQAAQAAGEAWRNPGVPKNLQDWQGVGDIAPSTSSAPVESALTTVGLSAKPEGATLRRWTT